MTSASLVSSGRITLSTNPLGYAQKVSRRVNQLYYFQPYLTNILGTKLLSAQMELPVPISRFIAKTNNRCKSYFP
jgi:hypothetical protein